MKFCARKFENRAGEVKLLSVEIYILVDEKIFNVWKEIQKLYFGLNILKRFSLFLNR